MQSHRWEDLLPEEFTAEFERAPLAYLAAAAPEEHGLHNPLGTDMWPPYEVCLRAARITGGIVFPLIPFAPAYFPGLSREEMRAGDKELYPPSLFVSRELCELAYTEVLEGMADMGFRAAIALAGHAPADTLLRDMTEAHGGVIRGMKFFGAGTYSLVQDFLAELARETPGSGGHGVMWETSLIMATAPGYTDLPRAERILGHPRRSQLQANRPEIIAGIQQANVELGEKTLQLTVERVVAKAEELLS
ncbi:creatininase family protein [bacterium]|nr:creatininase family protein [bacterium]